MQRMRWSGIVIVVLLALGLAACGDDDGSGVRDSGSSSASGGSGSTGGSGSSADEETTTTEAPDDTAADDTGGETATGVDAYCDAVERYIELLGEAIDDPTSAGAELQEAANDYATAAINLGELTPEEQTQFENCQQAAADAATDLTG